MKCGEQIGDLPVTMVVNPNYKQGQLSSLRGRDRQYSNPAKIAQVSMASWFIWWIIPISTRIW